MVCHGVGRDTTRDNRAMASGPKFIRFFWPIVQALRELGGAAPPREVVDLATETLSISDDERAERRYNQNLWITHLSMGAAYLPS